MIMQGAVAQPGAGSPPNDCHPSALVVAAGGSFPPTGGFGACHCKDSRHATARATSHERATVAKQGWISSRLILTPAIHGRGGGGCVGTGSFDSISQPSELVITFIPHASNTGSTALRKFAEGKVRVYPPTLIVNDVLDCPIIQSSAVTSKPSIVTMVGFTPVPLKEYSLKESAPKRPKRMPLSGLVTTSIFAPSCQFARGSPKRNERSEGG